MSAILSATDWRVRVRPDNSMYLECGGSSAHGYHMAFDVGLEADNETDVELVLRIQRGLNAPRT
jgi:hypothetical protein